MRKPFFISAIALLMSLSSTSFASSTSKLLPDIAANGEGIDAKMLKQFTGTYGLDSQDVETEQCSDFLEIKTDAKIINNREVLVIQVNGLAKSLSSSPTWVGDEQIFVDDYDLEYQEAQWDVHSWKDSIVQVWKGHKKARKGRKGIALFKQTTITEKKDRKNLLFANNLKEEYTIHIWLDLNNGDIEFWKEELDPVHRPQFENCQYKNQKLHLNVAKKSRHDQTRKIDDDDSPFVASPLDMIQ